MLNIRRVAVLAFLMLWSLSLQAQTCEPRFMFNYAAGGKGCIAELPIANDGVVGYATTVRTTVPASGMYSVASSPRGKACPAAVGMVIMRKYINGATTFQARDAPAERAKAAISDCQKKVDEAKPAGDCECKLILEDGSSPMSQAALQSFLAVPADAPK